MDRRNFFKRTLGALIAAPLAKLLPTQPRKLIATWSIEKAEPLISAEALAAGEAHMFKMVSSIWPKMMLPYLQAIQPVDKPVTVYYERFKDND